MKPIILEIFKDILFTEDEASLMFAKLKRVTLSKGEFLLQVDEEVTDLHYVQEGCLRSYLTDSSGKEHTLQFAVKGWWISDYIALFGKGNSKSVSYIECIKEATIYKISKSDFDNLCLEIPKIGQFHISKLESAFAAFQNRILENLTLPAKERYKNFVKAYPSIEQNVKNYHIASFLGITSESLSRIRKEMTLPK